MESETFRYKRFVDDRPRFRILWLDADCKARINCELIEAVLDDITEVLPYCAISYRWDSGSKIMPIYINGHKCMVTAGLYTMLQALREAKDCYPWFNFGYFWIDAICIDQEHDKEKAHQISNMTKIYSSATTVVVWLGESTEQSDLAFMALEAFKTAWERGSRVKTSAGILWHGSSDDWEFNWKRLWARTKASMLPSLELEHVSACFANVLSHSWFRRVWVLQEVANARSAFVLCGSRSVSTRYFAPFSRLLGVEPSPHCKAVLELMPSPIRIDLGDSNQGDAASSIRDVNETYNFSWYKPSFTESSFYRTLKRFRGAEAKEEKDRIFALIGLCSDVPAEISMEYYDKPYSDIIGAVLAQVLNCKKWQVPERLISQYTNIDAFLQDLDCLEERLLARWSESDLPLTLFLSLLIKRRNPEGTTLGRQSQETLMDNIIQEATHLCSPHVLQVIRILMRRFNQGACVDESDLLLLLSDSTNAAKHALIALPAYEPGRIRLTEKVIYAASQSSISFRLDNLPVPFRECVIEWGKQRLKESNRRETTNPELALYDQAGRESTALWNPTWLDLLCHLAPHPDERPLIPSGTALAMWKKPRGRQALEMMCEKFHVQISFTSHTTVGQTYLLSSSETTSLLDKATIGLLSSSESAPQPSGDLPATRPTSGASEGTNINPPDRTTTNCPGSQPWLLSQLLYHDEKQDPRC